MTEARLKEGHRGSGSETGVGDTVLTGFAFSHLSLSPFLFTPWLPLPCRVISTWQEAWYEAVLAFQLSRAKGELHPVSRVSVSGRTLMGSAGATCLPLYPHNCWLGSEVLYRVSAL